MAERDPYANRRFEIECGLLTSQVMSMLRNVTEACEAGVCDAKRADDLRAGVAMYHNTMRDLFRKVYAVSE